MISIRKITTQAEFESLECVWNPLLESSSSRALSLTWEWQSTWWQVFGNGGRELNILIATQNSQIVGVAPLLRRTAPHYGLPFTRLEFIGAGEDEADEICSEYLDFIIKQGLETEVVSAFLAYLYEVDTSWDEISLDAVHSESVNLKAIEESRPRNATPHQIVSIAKGAFITLPASYQEYFSRLGSNMRRDIRRDRRNVELESAELRIVESEQDFESNFRILIDLHEARWRPLGQPGAFASEKFTRFHHLLASRILNKGWIKLFILFVAGKPIAGLMVFAFDNKLLIYQSGLAESHSPALHPGTLIRDMSIEWAIRNGFSEWDMFRSRPGSYKIRWSSHTRDIVGIRLARSQSKEAIYAAAARVVDGLRHLRRALG